MALDNQAAAIVRGPGGLPPQQARLHGLGGGQDPSHLIYKALGSARDFTAERYAGVGAWVITYVHARSSKDKTGGERARVTRHVNRRVRL